MKVLNYKDHKRKRYIFVVVRNKIKYINYIHEVITSFYYYKFKIKSAMKTNEKPASSGKLKYLMVVPLIIMLVLLFNCRQSSQESSITVADSSGIQAQQTVAESEVFTTDSLAVDEQATFQGGTVDDFLIWVQDNIYYPEDALEYGSSGTVSVQFTVSPDGEIVDVNVLRGVTPSLDEEAKRVILSSPQWVPAKQGGNNVTQQFTIPVVFTLTE